tara:strand:+ start:714 stop:875 length:162 start_codon:yes stop_codon:yes gene_type:complete
MALTILDKEKYDSFKLDEKELQKATDAVIKKNAANKKNPKKPTTKKGGYVANF